MRWDIALPLVLLAAVLAMAVFAPGSWHLFSPARSYGPLDWVLLVVGPLSLLAWRRHPALVLAVTFAATFSPSNCGLTHLSFIIAFFLALATGKRSVALDRKSVV